MVILGHSSLSFEDLDGHSGLLVLIGGESLTFLGWDDSSSGDNLGHHSSHSFNTLGQGSHINQKHILGLFTSFSTQNTSLNSSSIGYSFIWVNTSIRFLSIEEILNKRLNFRNSSGPTNHHNFINFTLFKSSIIQNLLNRLQSLFKQIST